jgi:hypothetical protein
MEIAAPRAHIPSTAHSSIQELSPELLLIIFKFVYVASRRSVPPITPACRNNACLVENKCFCYRLSDEKSDWDTSGDPHPTTLFPNSLASVCSHWGKVMLLAPAFWTRVIIILDSNTFPPPDLNLQLNSAGDEPIDIIVARAAKSNTVDSNVEKSRMAYIITALCPHFRRCRKLCFNVVHSSSLPRLPGLLPPIMPHLQQLSLDGCIDSGCPTILPGPYDQPNKASEVNWSKLNTVVIDGWNFVDLYHRAPNLGEYIFPACGSLAIKFGGEGFPFSNVSEWLQEIPLRTFMVDSVSFSEDGVLDFDISAVVLKNLSAEVTDTILSSCVNLDYLEIINCSGSNIGQMPVTYSLTLQNIGVDQSIERFIPTWDGLSKLHVTSCPGFNDVVLEMMGKTPMSTDDSLSADGTHQWDLHIHQCNQFSVNALKELVRIRNEGPQEGAPLWKILVDAEFPLPEEDLHWFSKKVEEFEWVNIARE